MKVTGTKILINIQRAEEKAKILHKRCSYKTKSKGILRVGARKIKKWRKSRDIHLLATLRRANH